MGGDEALAPLTEAQAADLDRVVAELRIVLPDPTARDIHDYIEENMAASMGEWATANRVKKVNTRMNKAARAKAGVDRDMLEPDETDGPVVLEELGTWPDDTSLEEHLAEDEDTRIFSPDEHGAQVEGEDVSGGPSTALAYRRSLVACGGFWDGKLKVWCDHREKTKSGTDHVTHFEWSTKLSRQIDPSGEFTLEPGEYFPGVETTAPGMEGVKCHAGGKLNIIFPMKKA